MRDTVSNCATVVLILTRKLVDRYDGCHNRSAWSLGWSVIQPPSTIRHSPVLTMTLNLDIIG